MLHKKITRSPYSGSGLPKYKIAKPSSTTDLVYWDDPNELVDRLRLLVAEQRAMKYIQKRFYSLQRSFERLAIYYK